MFGFEIKVLQFLEGLRNGFLIKLFELITMLGEETVVILFIVALWFAFDKKLAQRIFFVTVTSAGVNSIVKNLVKIPRPWTTGKVTAVRQSTATGYSFPSGHSQSFASWSTMVALQVKKRWVSVTVVVLALLVGFSRLFLGVHYPSDVVAGLAIGVGLAFLGNYLFDKVENKQILYIGAALLMTPFLIFFMFEASELFRGFYKAYGMMWGLGAAVAFEDKYAPTSYDVPWWKKLLRILIGVAFAFALKEGIKLLYLFDSIRVIFLLDTFRYFAMVFVVGGICPWIFKKCKL